MSTINKVLSSLLILGFIILFMSIFIVTEGESALLLRLGKIVSTDKTSSIYGPGLHFKFPMIDQIKVFDTRLQELSTTKDSATPQPLVVVTKEQTYLAVDYFAKWRISDLQKFYTSTGGSISWAENLLEQRLNDIVRAEYGRRNSDEAIANGRASMIEAIREQANNIGKEQGIDVIDVRIQQISLPKDVMDSVFKRMETERKQFAVAKRAEGIEKSEEIKALADQKVTVIKAEALKSAAATRAEGDQEAAEIYAKAYNQDPNFYSFYKSLEAYESSFGNKNDVLVLKPEGQFFRYFHQTKK